MTLHTLNPQGYQIVPRKTFNQLVQKMFFSTSQPGSSMINQNPWMWYFNPNDMLWKEPDVEWRTRASWGSVAGGGEEWIGEALVGCRCRYFLVSQILHGFVVTLLLSS